MKFSLAKDDRRLAYLQTQRDGDVWLMDLATPGTKRQP